MDNLKTNVPPSLDVPAQSAAIGQAIRLARQARNMTLQELADRAGMTRQTAMRIERGDLKVSLGHWMNVLGHVGLLRPLRQALDPSNDPEGQFFRALQARKRVRQAAPRQGPGTDFDF